MKDTSELKETLEALLAGKLSPVKAVLGAAGEDLCLEVPAACLVEAAAVLKSHPQTAFDFLACITGVDLLPAEPRFELVYLLRSLSRNHRLAVRTKVPAGAPAVPSLTGLWRSADWFERETYDLLGVVFTGHPDLRRLLLPQDWEGYPLRKDYPLEGTGPQPGTPPIPEEWA